MGLYYYLIETGDLEFLNDELPYIDGTVGSVWDHIKTGMTISLRPINERGLARMSTGSGDWMDEFTKISKNGQAESVMLASQIAYILKGYAEIADMIGKHADRDEWLGIYERIKKGVNEHGWDGDWYIRAFSDRGETPLPVGSSQNDEGKIYLNSQSWAIISGIADTERTKKALDAVGDHLLSDYGALVFWPAYSKLVEYIGTQSTYAPGFRNANIYLRPAGWAVMAAAMADRTALAHDIYRSSSLAERSRDISRYLLEPYVYAENYIGPDHPRGGEGQFHWCFGEGTAWMWHAYVGYILGIRADLEGLVIDPKIPSEWSGYQVKRPFRNAVYEIEVKNPNKVSSGLKWIKVDGKKIKGNMIIPKGDNKVHKVEVMMG